MFLCLLCGYFDNAYCFVLFTLGKDLQDLDVESLLCEVSLMMQSLSLQR